MTKYKCAVCGSTDVYDYINDEYNYSRGRSRRRSLSPIRNNNQTYEIKYVRYDDFIIKIFGLITIIVLYFMYLLSQNQTQTT